jgi:ornithine carbamoyltransferase
MTEPRHFIDLDRIEGDDLRRILDLAHAFKHPTAHPALLPKSHRPLAGKTLAMVFEKPSTRTRVSFELAIKQLGGEAVVMSAAESQIGRGEPIADTARVLSRYVDAIMYRTTEHAKLEELARYASVPVINGLSELSHPCQIMADLMTVEEHRGPLAERVVAWSGDGNNVAASWIHAAVKLGFELRVATPPDLAPSQSLVAWASQPGSKVRFMTDPFEAVVGADCVSTDTWVSMGVEASVERYQILAPYQVDERLMEAASDAIFLHCLPANRGEEVTAAVIDGPRSVVWDEAENRLHAQKAILSWCLA